MFTLPEQSAAHGQVPERGPRSGSIGTSRYFVRRVAWHLLDRTWEIENRAMSLVFFEGIGDRLLERHRALLRPDSCKSCFIELGADDHDRAIVFGAVIRLHCATDSVK